MKGIVFNLFEEVICERFGELQWELLLESSGLAGVYTSLGSYDDRELVQLVEEAAQAYDLSKDAMLHSIGFNAIPFLVKRYPQFYQAHKNVVSFLLTLNEIIQTEVSKIYPDADMPVFEFDNSSDNYLMMSYQSSRQLCSLAEGLIEGAADYYQEHVTIEHITCQKIGDPKCIFHIHTHAVGVDDG